MWLGIFLCCGLSELRSPTPWGFFSVVLICAVSHLRAVSAIIVASNLGPVEQASNSRSQLGQNWLAACLCIHSSVFHTNGNTDFDLGMWWSKRIAKVFLHLFVVNGAKVIKFDPRGISTKAWQLFKKDFIILILWVCVWACVYVLFMYFLCTSAHRRGDQVPWN